MRPDLVGTLVSSITEGSNYSPCFLSLCIAYVWNISSSCPLAQQIHHQKCSDCRGMGICPLAKYPYHDQCSLHIRDMAEAAAKKRFIKASKRNVNLVLQFFRRSDCENLLRSFDISGEKSYLHRYLSFRSVSKKLFSPLRRIVFFSRVVV